jgi:acyl-CoA thioester hydrolase
MKIVEARLRVRYAETDQMGVVYHANYLIWMEVGRVEFCRAAGFRYRDLEDDGVRLAVVEANCRYLSPALYDDEVVIRTRIETANPRVVRFAYEMDSAEGGKRLAEGFTVHVFCGSNRKAARLPQKYHAVFGIGEGSGVG